jgi:hypothetical protein
MGLIAGNIGIVPSEKVVFRNATGNTTAIYKQAQRNYDQALSKLNTLVAELSNKKTELANFDAAYNSGVLPIADDKERAKNDLISKVLNNKDYNDVIDIVMKEGFGFCGSPKWGRIVGDMRREVPNGKHFNVAGVCGEGTVGNEFGYKCASGVEAACVADETNNDWYAQIYKQGLANTGIRRDVQVWLAQKWAETMKSIRTSIVGEIKGYEGVDGLIPKQTILVNEAKDRLDKAIIAEEKASGQRIKEQMVSPEYLKAKAEADKILLDAQAKKRMSRNILILGLAAAALVGVLVVTRKK